MRRPGRLRFGDREAGSATVFVVGFAVILLALAGLVIDGGLAINARQRVADDVEQAARAGAQDLDIVQLRKDGVVEIEPDQAEQDARDFLTARKYAPDHVQVWVGSDQMTVHVQAQTQQKTTLLSLIGIKDFTIQAQSQARPSVGIDNGGAP